MRKSEGYPLPVLEIATKEDVPEIVDQMIAASSNNNLILQLRYPSPEHLAKMDIRMRKVFTSMIEAPDYIMLKAVDPETKVIAATAAWQFVHFKDAELASVTGRKQHADERLVMQPQVIIAAGLVLNDGTSDQDETGGPTIWDVIEEAYQKFIKAWMGSTKSIYLASLSTHPRFQRRGIGTALLTWGHELADKHGVPSFLVSTPFGHPLYEHLGWRDVERPLKLELQKWAPYASNGDMGWGTFKYYYMLRMPKNAIV
ncbi:hypothetical protein BP6252_00422 [Coleophoma cylindrospora]|uniref:N-acetyltransferase domain-containing protein n=1 Tax=Coleophoma cylindrospora TaxID=1849047 RepID=A0A3D8SPZ6_9HELO|nr:hypothetical protein BP6252_00422 [Coleophoma cylindrospora]